MGTGTNGAAASHVGRIRANNQDSGYAGVRLFVVADGMGGHAGGDVASAIAVQRILEADVEYTSAHDAEFALQAALIAANSLLAESVFEHPELTGMGTTVSALVRVDDKVAIAHIGDSRIYLFRDGELSQISVDHTFVQRLVDSGRITPEEAAVHPRRSVLMRVLGDVDSAPEIDTMILDTRAGDRWLICSDGLSGVVSDSSIAETMIRDVAPNEIAADLVRKSLDGGAPDNVTVVVVDIDSTTPAPGYAPVTVGSAAAPLGHDAETKARATRLPLLRLHTLKAQAPESHFESQSEEYLDELIAEDKRRARRRKHTWLAGIILIVAAVVLAVVLSYQWTQSRYFVGTNGETVVIYQGVQQDLGPIRLSHPYVKTSLNIDELRPYDKAQVEQTINAQSYRDAIDIVNRLTDASIK